MKHRWTIALLMMLVFSFGGWAQDVSFPYPEIPTSLTGDKERLAYVLEHFWNSYDFSDASQTNQKVGEQGFVDYINLMAYADSMTCVQSAKLFADKLASSGQAFLRFEELAHNYLENSLSPLRNDTVFMHLLRAFPSSPQRLFLIQQLSLNQPGTRAADVSFVDASGNSQHLYDIQCPYTLLVFFDPECEHCQEQMPQIRNASELHKNTSRLKVVYIDTNLNPDVLKRYHLPVLPSLYLLDEQKRIVVKDGTLQQIISRINALLP